MSVQPVVHGSITLNQSQPVTPARSKKLSSKMSARTEAVRIAKAKISRRNSLMKQREALKN
jgi:hypothetical protein